jgi:hypothetical protein
MPTTMVLVKPYIQVPEVDNIILIVTEIRLMCPNVLEIIYGKIM